MIIKGKSRAGPGALAAHLGNAETNEKITLLETRGTIADDLRGAFLEMDAYAAGTRCEKPLYHAAISPEPPHRLSPEQRAEAIDALEKKLGLEGHARVTVLHEKQGREHLHVVWSRIDLDRNRAVSDGHNYRKHEEVARDLERRFGHERVQGAHHERDGVERPDRTPSRAELRQEERTGIKGKQVREEVAAAFRSSDTAEAFKAALDEKGYILARGDRRDFVIVDRAGGIHSLARRVDGMNAAELREFMSPVAREDLPSADQARETQRDRAWDGISRTEEEEKRRAQEKREALEEAKLGAAYGRGDDYVSQTRAAAKDHEARQEALNRKAEEEKLRRQAEEITKNEQARSESSQGKKQSFEANAAEMSDAQQERLSRLFEEIREESYDPERDYSDPDRQREAPGGGRTRSR